jgi:hypothetical protein
MSSSDGADAVVTRAATSMQFSPDTPPRTPTQTPLLARPAPPITSDRNSTGGAGECGAILCVSVTPVKKGGSTADVLDFASPPPRPPRCSESSDDVRPASDSDNSHEHLLHLEAPAHGTHHGGCAMRGPFASMDASDSTNTPNTTHDALLSTTQLLDATTMPPAPSESSRDDSALAFSPSVHRPTSVADNGRPGRPPRGDAFVAHGSPTSLHGPRGHYDTEDLWDRDPSNGYANDNPANFTTGTQITPTECLALQDQSDGDGNDAHLNHHNTNARANSAESDDEDEDGLFQETVLFMNNTIQSLGSTRRTPNKPAQQQQHPQTPQLRGGSSPVPKTPDSLDVTPTKPTREGTDDGRRHRSDSASDECRPGRDDAKSIGGVGRGYQNTLPPEMNASATTTNTQAYMTAPDSPASPNSRVPAPPTSLFLPPQQACAELPETFTTDVAVATTLSDKRGHPVSNNDSEYLFIDNHDGTAYLADASLQLDGSYALGQTILLARSGAPSPSSASVRRGANSGKSSGAMSPVVVPQTADNMPQQREKYAHRPVRGVTLPEAATSMSCVDDAAGSPIPASVIASPMSPSVARVIVRRSPAPAREDAVVGEVAASPHSVAAGASVSGLPPSFCDSFAFDQTLLVPLDDTLRSDVAGGTASPLIVVDRRRWQLSMQKQSEAGQASSYRSTAPARWDNAASPTVVVPTSPAASFSIYQGTCSSAASMAGSFSASRASPVPHAPSVSQQLASQQARAARDTRPSRSKQDIIYLVPPGAATATMTSQEIAAQGWIPVQVVDVLPNPTTLAGSPALGNHAAYGGNPRIVPGGRTASPLPTNPEAAATTHATHADVDDRSALRPDNEDVVREQSLSRLSHGHHDTGRNSSFSLASTLSASTLDCINRRLSYSLSGWASARQRFGHSLSMGDRSSVSGTVMPPATPLTLAVDDYPLQQHLRCTRAAHATSTDSQTDHHPSNLTIRLNSGGRGVGGLVSLDDGSPQAREGDDGSGSPVPLPPGTPETPQREQSPSRCTTMSTPAKTRNSDEQQAPLVAEDESHAGGNSLLTSMSYQRPSTMATSDEYPGDYSMSLPLTSSASQSVGFSGGHPTNNFSNSRLFSAESLNMPHPLIQHQPLRAPHPRRVSGTTALSQGASSLSFQTFGEQSDQQSAAASVNNSNSNVSNMSAAAAAAAAAASFRTTYCNNRVSPGSVRAASLNYGGGPALTVSGAGLPLSRGNLGASVGARGGVATTAAVAAGADTPTHGTNHLPPHKNRYPQQYAAAAERRRAGLVGGYPTAATATHVNAGSLSIDSFAARSGAVSRNFPQHHPYLSVQQQQQQQHTRRTGAAGRGNGSGAPRRSAGAHLVPDTSVFLPWAPLTITPEGSLNLSREDRDGAAAAATAMDNADGAHMSLVPFNSSLETSTVTTTTTTHTTATSGVDGGCVSVREVAQQLANNCSSKEDNSEFSPETLRTLNAAVVAMSRAANDGSGEAFLNGDGTVNKEAFVSSFLQHAASQAAASVGDGSLNTASMMATTTTTTIMSGAAKSLAVSRASMTVGGLHLQDHSQRFDFESMTTMEATMNQFQGSVSAASAQEPEPRAPPLRAVANQAEDKENTSAVRASATRKSEPAAAMAVTMGLREGSPVNAVRHSGKAPSPPRTAPVTGSHAAMSDVA